jgi:hypothetical protein
LCYTIGRIFMGGGCENGVLRKVFGPNGRKEKAFEENCAMRSFVSYTPRHTL